MPILSNIDLIKYIFSMSCQCFMSIKIVKNILFFIMSFNFKTHNLFSCIYILPVPVLISVPVSIKNINALIITFTLHLFQIYCFLFSFIFQNREYAPQSALPYNKNFCILKTTSFVSIVERILFCFPKEVETRSIMTQ